VGTELHHGASGTVSGTRVFCHPGTCTFGRGPNEAGPCEPMDWGYPKTRDIPLRAITLSGGKPSPSRRHGPVMSAVLFRSGEQRFSLT
jgi:hypothetical protein